MAFYATRAGRLPPPRELRPVPRPSNSHCIHPASFSQVALAARQFKPHNKRASLHPRAVRTQLGHKTECLESETCGNREN